MIELLFAILLVIQTPARTLAQIKSVSAKPDEIVNVKLGLGIATIVQLPEAIQSVVIGDQSSFKVEYLDHAVTIKPLRYSATTNLYLTTMSRRYILRLATGRSDRADYIVYVKDQRDDMNVRWHLVSKSVSSKISTLTIKRVGSSRAGFLLLDLKFSSHDKQEIKPDTVWLSQDGQSKVINGLYLSSSEVSPSKPVALSLSILKTDLAPNRPLTVELRLKYPLKVEVTAEVVWQ